MWENQRNCHSCKMDKKLKIKSVAITQSQHNELGKLVDYVIAIPSEEKELRIRQHLQGYLL